MHAGTLADTEELLPTLRPRWLAAAWKVIVVVDVGVLVWGIMATLDPSVLTAGFETYTGGTWDAFATREGEVAEFVLAGFRLVGALNVAVALTLIAIAALAFPHGRRWAWWALLIGNTFAIAPPIIYDRFVGYIGPFEALEYVGLLLTYAALGAAAPVLRGRPSVPGRVSG